MTRPSLALLDSYLDFIEALRAGGDTVWESFVPRGDESPAAFVGRLLQADIHPQPDRVPETSYWAVVDGEVVGRISLRHHLNENLREFGGHVGYEVKPSWRRRGVATRMLGLVLDTPKARDIGHLLVTCSPGNVGSVKAIVANGGVLERTVFVARVDRETCHYRVPARGCAAP